MGVEWKQNKTWQYELLESELLLESYVTNKRSIILSFVTNLPNLAVELKKWSMLII